jgi:hypothetical protein
VDIKLRRSPLSAKDVSQVIKMLAGRQAGQYGLIVAPNGFAEDAIRIAEQTVAYFPVLLLDGDHLQALMAETNGRRWLESLVVLARKRHTAWVSSEDIRLYHQGGPHFARDVYLVHAISDVKIAGEIAEGLQAENLTIWFDSRLAVHGQSVVTVREGLARGRHPIVLLTPAIIADHGIMSEIKRICRSINPKSGERRLVPVKVVDCEMPAFLKAYLYIDLRDSESHDLTVKFLADLIKDGE